MANTEIDTEAKHLDHVEDRAFLNPHKAVESLLAVAHGQTSLSTKYDGSPAIVFGRDPDSGEFFVGTKSVFNKKIPKINRSYDEIEVNHGSDPGLMQKLFGALKYLPSIAPKNGVFMGDMMYADGDVKDDGRRYSFTPNTITYLTPRTSEEGLKIANARFGIVLHTAFDGDSLSSMRPVPIEDFGVFRTSSDVHVIDPRIDPGALDSRKVDRTIERIDEQIKFIHKDLDLKQHYARLVRYMNNCVRHGKDPTDKGYAEFLTSELDTRLSKLLSPVGRSNAIASDTPFIKDAEKKSDSFKALFRIHKYIADTKKAILKELKVHVPYEHEYRGRPTDPEGFVARSSEYGSFKLVDRNEFSRLNFDVHDLRKLGREKPRNPETVVVAWGRFNPPTAGHSQLVGKVLETARRASSDHLIVMSRTVDGKKNPLDPQTKEKYAKAFFPGVKIKLANAESPTIISLMKELDKKYKHLILVVGDDRVDEFKRVLNKYNGKDFTFETGQIVSAGSRDPESDGVEGVSATKMREAAVKNDYASFSSQAPMTVSDEIIRNMFNDIRTAVSMGPPKDGPGTDRAKDIEASNGGAVEAPAGPINKTGDPAKSGSNHTAGKRNKKPHP